MHYNGITFQIDFDFIEHVLLIGTSAGHTKTIALRPRSVADFYQETMSALGELEIYVPIWTTPVEVQDRTPFEEDDKHASYNPEYVQRLWRILSQASRVFTDFRSLFIGKVSPVHFFWGAFDLAVTRFSGRTAPPHPGAAHILRQTLETLREEKAMQADTARLAKVCCAPRQLATLAGSPEPVSI